MERNDTFAGGDPFAGSDFGDWEQSDWVTDDSSPPAKTEESSPPVKVEDPKEEYDVPGAQEGEPPTAFPAPLDSATVTAPPDAQPPVIQRLPGPARAIGSPVPPAPPPLPSQAPVAPEQEVAGAAPPEPAAVPAPAPAQEAATPSGGVQVPPEPQNGSESAEEEARRREVEEDVPIVTSGLPGVVAEPASPNGAPVTEGEAPPAPDAPEPEETKDKRGRVTHRRYVLLRHEGGHKFVQLEWYEDPSRALVQRGTPKAKRQTIVLARGTEDALKFGYLVSGTPQDGVPLVAVAAAYFQVKHVAPEPPEPSKQRLRIT